MSEAILYAFWGRKANIELQLPFINRILDEHPGVEFHGWNLSQTDEDDHYIRSLPCADRFSVSNQFHGIPAGDGWNMVWEFYTHRHFSNHTFAKLDDDVIFIETERFGDYLEAIDLNRGYIISPYVVNNGATTAHLSDAGTWLCFKALGIDILDVHKHVEYAEMCHNIFISNYAEMLNLPVELVACEDWLSINMIGYDYSMGCEIQKLLGKRSPDEVAGRKFTMRSKVGDEGAVNMLPRLLMKGLVAVHLTFGPQNIPEDLQDYFRKAIGKIGKEYLG